MGHHHHVASQINSQRDKTQLLLPHTCISDPILVDPDNPKTLQGPKCKIKSEYENKMTRNLLFCGISGSAMIRQGLIEGKYQSKYTTLELEGGGGEEAAVGAQAVNVSCILSRAVSSTPTRVVAVTTLQVSVR